MSTNAAQESLPGWRHSNDYIDFSSIRIPPSVDEILCPSTPFLPPTASAFSHLDRLFRLLRHELVAGVIDAMADTRRARISKGTKGGGSIGLPNRLVLAQAKRGAVVADGNGGAASLLFHFSWPTSHPLSRMGSATRRLEYLRANSGKSGDGAAGAGRDMLKVGSLVVVMDKRLQPKLFATVAHREESLLVGGDGAVNNSEEGLAGNKTGGGKGDRGISGRGGGDRSREGKGRKSDEWRRRQEARPAVGLSFFSLEDWKTALLLSRDQSWGCLVPLYVEVSAYEPVLKSLQAMGDLPMRDLVVGRQNTTRDPVEHGSKPQNVSQTVTSGASAADVVPHSQPPEPPLYEGRESRAIAQLAEYFASSSSDIESPSPSPSLPEEETLPDGCHWNTSQRMAVAQVLRQRVSLVEGSPGTGKTLLGVCLGKLILSSTRQKILCLCPTDNSLDSLLGGMHDAGVTSMVSLNGDTNNAKLAPYQLENPPARDFSKAQTRQLAQLKKDLDTSRSAIAQVQHTSKLNVKPETSEVVKWLRRHRPQVFQELLEAKVVGDSSDPDVDMEAASAITASVVPNWLGGHPRPTTCLQPMASAHESATASSVWSLSKNERKAAWVEWQTEMKPKAAKAVAKKIGDQHKLARELSRLRLQKDLQRIAGARIVGCTMTEAAAHHELLAELPYDVVLVDDAGEVLEAHILTTLRKSTKHLIMIGDHRQRRPKVEQYDLCVESGKGLDLNVSLSERLIQGGYPHNKLDVQYRMPPEISALVKGLADRELRDGPGTSNRPPIRGVRDRVCFVAHRNKETTVATKQWRKVSEVSASKTNPFEVRMVVKTVRYLLLQGYEPDQILVVTTYCAQLLELREAMKKARGSGDISTEACSGVQMTTIESYVGEEGDIVICSFVRSKRGGPMGLVAEPNRLNFAISRARHGMILFGDIDLFTSDKAVSESGRRMWLEFAALLEAGGHVYRDGLPVVCEAHGTRADLPTPEAFDELAPDGGCGIVCGATLPCGHPCPRRCHPGHRQSHDTTPCKVVLNDSCARGHVSKRFCSKDRLRDPCSLCKRGEAVGKQEAAIPVEELCQGEEGEASPGSGAGRPEGVPDGEKAVHETGMRGLDNKGGRVKPNAKESKPSGESLCGGMTGLRTAAHAMAFTGAYSHILQPAGTAIGAASRPPPQDVVVKEPPVMTAGMNEGGGDGGERADTHEGLPPSAGHGRRSTAVNARLSRMSGLAAFETSVAQSASGATSSPTAWRCTWSSSRTEQKSPEVSAAIFHTTSPPPDTGAATEPPFGEASGAPEDPDELSDNEPFLCVEDIYILREACEIAGLPSDSPDLFNLGENIEVHEALRSTLVLARAEGGIGFSPQQAQTFLRKLAADRAALSRLKHEAKVAGEKRASDLARAEHAVAEVDEMVAQAAKKDEDQELLGGTLAEVFAAAEATDTALRGQEEEDVLQAAVTEADAAVRKEAAEGSGGEELLVLLMQVKQARQHALDNARAERGDRAAALTKAQEAKQQALRRDKEEREKELALKVKAKWEKRGELARLRNEVDRIGTEETASKAVLRRMGACPSGFDLYRQGAGWRCAGGSHYVPGGTVAIEVARWMA